MTCTSGQPLSRLTSRRRWLATLATTTSLLLVGGCGSTQANDEGFVAGDGSLTILPIDRRPTAPVIEGVTLDDQPWTSAKISDKVIVYNVWGSWCAPCVSEAPALVRASRRLDNQAAFVGLNTRDFDKAAPRAFVRAYEIPYVNLFNPQKVLIAGEITAAEEILIPAIRRCVEHQSLPSFHRGLPIVKARFQNQPTIGGFALVKRSLLEGDLLQIIMEQK